MKVCFLVAMVFLFCGEKTLSARNGTVVLPVDSAALPGGRFEGTGKGVAFDPLVHKGLGDFGSDLKSGLPGNGNLERHTNSEAQGNLKGEETSNPNPSEEDKKDDEGYVSGDDDDETEDSPDHSNPDSLNDQMPEIQVLSSGSSSGPSDTPKNQLDFSSHQGTKVGGAKSDLTAVSLGEITPSLKSSPKDPAAQGGGRSTGQDWGNAAEAITEKTEDFQESSSVADTPPDDLSKQIQVGNPADSNTLERESSGVSSVITLSDDKTSSDSPSNSIGPSQSSSVTVALTNPNLDLDLMPGGGDSLGKTEPLDLNMGGVVTSETTAENDQPDGLSFVRSSEGEAEGLQSAYESTSKAEVSAGFNVSADLLAEGTPSLEAVYAETPTVAIAGDVDVNADLLGEGS